MKSDIIFVSYNSEKWIDGCFAALALSDYDRKEISILVVDNHSKDGTLRKLQENQEKYRDVFGSFTILRNEKNMGFGRANNLGFLKSTAPIVCFFNIDTEVYPDTLKNLSSEIEKSDASVGLWELRQFPYEHPKYYDPITLETSWSSGAAFAVRHSVFEEVKGFDDRIFLYAEDVDLSWRIRSCGYKLRYTPKAVIRHYSYTSANEIKPNQYIYSLVNNLMLRCRYGNKKTVIRGHLGIWKQIACNRPFPHARRKLLKAYLKSLKNIPYFCDRSVLGSCAEFHPAFFGYDYEMIRDGAFVELDRPSEYPLVSVIVRTCGRPAVLRETLCSLRNQTYPNLEIVVWEDGKDTAGKMIREEFSDLNILYRASGKRSGRSAAGNQAMEISHGKYLNFLDDDDLMFADHIEVLVKALEGKREKAAYAFGFETPIRVLSKVPYRYEVLNYLGVHKQKFDRIILSHHNYIPIQCILFDRELFELYGGLDETLDYLEDWDLWVRYATHTDYICVPKTTSVYRTPAEKEVNAKRQHELDEALKVVRKKHKSYTMKVSVYDLAACYEKR